MKHPVYAIVLAGGSGNRLWPLSTPACPKQFIEINNTTLFTQALERAKLISDPVLVVTHQAQKELAKKWGGHLFTQLLCEPTSKNTAAAIIYAALWIQQESRNALLVVMPSDHAIKPMDQFHDAIKTALRAVQTHAQIVLIGAAATSPSPEYGYIELGDLVSDNCYNVHKFIEKPQASYAQALIEQGNVVWNTGMVVASVQVILEVARRYAPVLVQELQRYITTQDERVYESLPAQSFDRAILEHMDNLSVVKSYFSWSDLGTIPAFLSQHRANIDEIQSHNNKVWSHKRVTLVNVHDLCIIDTPQELIICSQESAHGIYRLKHKSDKL